MIQRLVIAAVVTAVLVSTAAPPTFASHEGDNSLTFAPVPQSPLPTAAGIGLINYVAGTSAIGPNSVWTSAFQFRGLTANAPYTVVVAGRFADPTAFSGLCSFTTDSSGNGGCGSQFLGLSRLTIAQLRWGNEAGLPVLQATWQTASFGPGSIDHQGDCEQPSGAGTVCQASGRE
jgi:hypothetical protein